MYEPTLDIPNAHFIPGENAPPITVSEYQANPSQTYAVIATEGSHTDWSVSTLIGNLASSGKVDTRHDSPPDFPVRQRA